MLRRRRTRGGSASWSVSPRGLPEIGPGGVVYVVWAHCVTNGQNSTEDNLGFAKSTDGGVTWALVNVGGGVTGYGTIKWVPGTSICYTSASIGASGCVLESTNDGATWTVMNTAGITGLTHMELVYINGQITAYAIAPDGSCIKLSKFPTGIDPNNTGIPTSYALEQNYPNPFNPSTNVRFSVPNAGDVSLKVYDLVGHEVMTVVNGYKAAGNYVETINASGLASGIYFYTLRAGNYVETKKMSLVK